MYPLLIDNTIKLFVIENNGNYQIDTALVNELNSLTTDTTDFALVYDRTKGYLYANGSFTQISESSFPITDRSVLNITRTLNATDITTVSRSDHADLRYTAPTAAYSRSLDYVGISMNRVLQGNYSELCWAASVACIANFYNGTSLSAYGVAVTHQLPDKPINSGRPYTETISILNSYVGNQNYYTNASFATPPTDSIIRLNMENRHPILSAWNAYETPNTAKGHLMVVTGINTSSANGYVFVMDPLSGFRSIFKSNGKYSYVNSNNNLTYTFEFGACVVY